MSSLPAPARGPAPTREILSLPHLKVSVRRAPAVDPSDPAPLILSIVGELDSSSVEAFHGAFEGLFAQGESRFIVDLEGAQFLGSGAFGVLLYFSSRAEERRGCLRMVRVPDSVQTAIHTLGFHHYLKIYADESEALRVLPAEKAAAGPGRRTGPQAGRVSLVVIVPARATGPDGKPVLVLRIHGPLDAHTLASFEEKMGRHVEECARIVLNAQWVTTANSQALAYLLKLRQLLVQRRGYLRLCCLPDFLPKLLENLGLHRYIETYPSEEEAVGK